MESCEPPTLKTCSRCKEVKSTEEFTKKKTSKDGLRSYCRECCRKDAERWRANTKEQRALRGKEYHEKHRDRIIQRQKEWRKNNPEKAKMAGKRWAESHPEFVSERRARRRAAKRQATPPWLNSEHYDQFRAIYGLRLEMQELTGVEYHVDHIHPLIHPLVCGLHVPWNLQVITAEENLSKGNKFEAGGGH